MKYFHDALGRIISMIYERQVGVPKFECLEYRKKDKKYALLIPIINEGSHIKEELRRAVEARVYDLVDIIICDGDSKDGSTQDNILKKLKVNTLLVKKDIGKQGAQLRMGIWWSLNRGYEGIVTIDGNDKDSIEDVLLFVKKLDKGFDFIQGSRFIKGGKAINTPKIRFIALKLIHAPIISITARKKYTDTTNNFRAYSKKYLMHEKVNPLRDIFMTYELLAYLSVRADQIGLKTCEVPVTRKYPKEGRTRTKISLWKGNLNLMKILFANLFHQYNVKSKNEVK